MLIISCIQSGCAITRHPVSTTVSLALGEVEAPEAGDSGGEETSTPSQVEPDLRRHRVSSLPERLVLERVVGGCGMIVPAP